MEGGFNTMDLTDREDVLLDQIACNLFNRGLIPQDADTLGMVKAELECLVRNVKYLTYDQISDLLMNHAMNWKTIQDEIVQDMKDDSSTKIIKLIVNLKECYGKDEGDMNWRCMICTADDFKTDTECLDHVKTHSDEDIGDYMTND